MELIHRINEGPLTQALRMLPGHMDTLRARALILKTGLQESLLIHRQQIGGPARSLLQFEAGGGIRGVLNHHTTKHHARKFCKDLGVIPSIHAVYAAMSTNDVLGMGFGRLNYYWNPDALPDIRDEEEGFKQYLFCWRPGAYTRGDSEDRAHLRAKWELNHRAVNDALING